MHFCSKATEMCCGQRNGSKTQIFRFNSFVSVSFPPLSQLFYTPLGTLQYNETLFAQPDHRVLSLTKLRWIQSVWGENKGPWGSYLRDAVLVLTCGKVVGKPPRWHWDRRLEEDENREEEEKKTK